MISRYFQYDSVDRLTQEAYGSITNTFGYDSAGNPTTMRGGTQTFNSKNHLTITGYAYIPGEFWPVNPISVRSKEALFCVNERLITWMDTPAGLSAVVAVGATCVSRIHAAYDQLVTHSGQPAKIFRYPQGIPVQKGDELGMFEMGSTVILLFASGKVRWDSWLQPEAALRMGRRIGEVT